MYTEYKRKMTKTIESLKHQFATVRAGRANAGVLDSISVEYYGVDTPLNQVGTISVPDPRTMEKAIRASALGINPQNEGKLIRLTFPQLTEERRKDLVKQVKKYSEDGKVAIRNIRRDAMDDFKALKKANELTEDDLKTAEKELQKLTDDFIKEVDNVTAAKEKELYAI